jgi:hypothetical protein
MNGISSSSDVVAIILSKQEVPRVVRLSEAESVAPSVNLTGQTYVDSGIGDWIGFFDWLRDSSGQIIGVRQWVDEPSKVLFSEQFFGVESDEKRRVLCAYFGSSREVDEVASCNQDFGNNRLLVAGDSIALTFGTGAMK